MKKTKITLCVLQKEEGNLDSGKTPFFRKVGQIIVLAIIVASLNSCCSFPLFSKCSPDIPMQIKLIADDDSNGGLSVKVTAYLLTNSKAFMNMPPKDFFATGKEKYVQDEVGYVPEPLTLFVRPGETAMDLINIPRESLGNSDMPLFLGVIAYFSSPAPGEDRMLIPLTGRDFPRNLDIQVTSNSLFPAR